MANDDLITQYNQLMWKIDQTRGEVSNATEAYADKLKKLRKTLTDLHSNLEWVTKQMSNRNIPLPSPVAMSVSRDAGFHPQG